MAIDTGSDISSQIELTRNVNDFNSTNKLREQARSGGDEALREVAQQFEAIFMRMLLKTMRQAQDTFSDKDNPLNSDQMKFYRDMHDQQLAVNLSGSGSLGLADVIVQQLKGPTGFRPAPAVHMNTAGVNAITQQPDITANKLNKPAASSEISMNASADAATAKEKRAVFESPEEFVEHLLPKVQNAADKLGLDPKALVAQAALETGWGQFIMHDNKGNSANNLFGIKADSRWDGEKVVVNTMENSGGVTEKIRAAFRSYGNFSESINDYVDFLKSSSRYGEALNKTGNALDFFNALQDAGYATDPDYANKVISIYQGNLLNGFLK